MKASEKELLAKISTKIDFIHEAVKGHSDKLDQLVPMVEGHGTSIAWIKWAGGAGASLLTAVCGYLFTSK